MIELRCDPECILAKAVTEAEQTYELSDNHHLRVSLYPAWFSQSSQIPQQSVLFNHTDKVLISAIFPESSAPTNS